MSQQPVQFPFHVTIKWPAQGGLPDVMINVYADAAVELAERIGEALEAARSQVPALAAVTEVPAPAQKPARRPEPRPQEREEPRYERDDDSPNVTCIHGKTHWQASNYGGWFNACCKLRPNGELVARQPRNTDRISPASPTGRFVGSRR